MLPFFGQAEKRALQSLTQVATIKYAPVNVHDVADVKKTAFLNAVDDRDMQERLAFPHATKTERRFTIMNQKTLTPRGIFKELKKNIVGQSYYLHDLSICIWLHNLRREHFLRTGERVKGPKYNMLVIGKSGMGKTSAIQAATELLEIPVVLEDASQLRGSGWKGKQVAEIVRDIQEAAAAKGIEQEAAEFSIVILDEIDKVFSGSAQEKSFYPIDNLLKFMEGTECGWDNGTNRVQMRTHDLLFICIGAFDGLEEIIKRRLKPTLGFSMPRGERETPAKNTLKEVSTEDLAAYGVSRQFLGRLPLITVMNELTCRDYEDILLKSEISPVKQLDTLLQLGENVSLDITRKAAEKLAERAICSGLGARALQHELANLMKDTLYDIPEDTKNKGYRIDYKNGFTVCEIEGERPAPYGKEMDVPLQLSQKEKQLLCQVKLDTIPEEMDSIQVYAEQMFEPYEERRFRKCPPGGLADIYSYMDIRRAQFLTAAAITQLFIDARYESTTGKDMAALLDVIQTLPLTLGSPFLPQRRPSHPLEHLRNLFLERLSRCTAEGAEEIRGIAWTVVHKYAMWRYNMNFWMTNNECSS